MIWLGWLAVAVVVLVGAIGTVCMFVEFPADWESDDETEGE